MVCYTFLTLLKLLSFTTRKETDKKKNNNIITETRNKTCVRIAFLTLCVFGQLSMNSDPQDNQKQEQSTF